MKYNQHLKMAHQAVQLKIATIAGNLFSDVLDLYAGSLQLFVQTTEYDLNYRDRERLMLQLMNHLVFKTKTIQSMI